MRTACCTAALELSASSSSSSTTPRIVTCIATEAEADSLAVTHDRHALCIASSSARNVRLPSADAAISTCSSAWKVRGAAGGGGEGEGAGGGGGGRGGDGGGGEGGGAYLTAKLPVWPKHGS